MKKNGNMLKLFLVPLAFFFISIGIGAYLFKNEFGEIITWWLVLLTLGIVAYPVAGLIFSRFHDGGFVFSKAIGVAEAGILMWYLSSLKLMKFSRVNSMVCVGICLLLHILLVLIIASKRKKAEANGEAVPEPYPITAEKLSAAVKSEVIFFAFFLFWCYLRGFKPEAFGNTEKFMDYGFMAVMDRSDYMPPEDLWMAGKSINYYYVGQYLATYLSKLSGVEVAYAYNLMLMALAAFSFSMPFSIAGNLTRVFFADRSRKLRTEKLSSQADRNTEKNAGKKKSAMAEGILPPIVGTAAGLAVSIAGNMHYLIFRFLVPFAERLSGSEEVSSFWFPNSTRYIGYNPETSDKTIHEFPSYSFILGDLHAHVINIMFVLTVLGMLLAWLMYRKEQMDELRLGNTIKKPSILREAFHPMILALGFFIGLFHMTNFWDFPIYFVVAGAIILFSNAAVYQFSMDTVKLTALQAVVVLVVSKIISLPFTLNFHQISTEIRLCVYRTPLHQLAVLWGLPVFLIVIYLCDRYSLLYRKGLLGGISNARRSKKREKKKAAGSRPEEQLPGADEVRFVPEKNKLYQFIENLPISDLYILTIGLCAIGLVMIPEIIYVKDIYSGDYKRANTMFKLTYQAYIMFGICMAYILARLIAYGRNRFQKAAGLVCGLCFLTTLGYFGNASRAWFGDYFNRSRFEGLDATAFLSGESWQDAAAIAWLNENIEGTPVVLEANGDSYSYYERVSVFTGLPTVLGWRTHEWLWRSDRTGGFPADVAQREQDVKALYTSLDREEVLALIQQYDIAYIYVGASERGSSKFEEPVNEELIRSLGDIVFETVPDETGATTYIVKIRR